MKPWKGKIYDHELSLFQGNHEMSNITNFEPSNVYLMK